jgi:hypothetical protein
MHRRRFTKLQSFKHLLLAHFEHVRPNWSVRQLFLPFLREKGEKSREIVGKTFKTLGCGCLTSIDKIEMEPSKLRRI